MKALPAQYMQQLAVLAGLLLAVPCQADGEWNTDRLHTEFLYPFTGTAQPPSTACPSWLAEYAEFHKANKGSPDATYIVEYCPALPRKQCNGFAHYKKIFLLVWEYPDSLTHYLAPASIDWTTQGLDAATLNALNSPEESPFDVHISSHDSAIEDVITQRRNITAEFNNTKMIRAQAIYWPSAFINGTDDEAYILQNGELQFIRCLFQFLFRPTDLVKQKAEKTLIDLYGPQPHPFTAWHWRVGGMVAETVLGRLPKHKGTQHLRTSKLRQIMSVTEYTHAKALLTYGKGLHEKPLLLVTDNNVIRKWVAGGVFKQVVASNLTVAHNERDPSDAGGFTSQDHLNSWADVLMLASADCLVYCASGYSYVALWMGNTTCVYDMHEIINADAARLTTVD